MFRYFIHLAYKGTNYSGWQIQPNAPSVQETLQKCLSTILREKITVTGAGRTDTGVHARSFYAHFNTKVNLSFSTKDFIYKLNQFLPKDIVIFDICKMHNEAHSRFDAISRTYKYYISLGKEIFQGDYCWQINFKPDMDQMNLAASELLKFNDFTSFSKLHTDVKTNICKIEYAAWNMESKYLIFTIKADRFLRNMVRSIVGTLIEVGKKKLDINEFQQIILMKDRAKAGMSVPAEGLFLERIEYPYKVG